MDESFCERRDCVGTFREKTTGGKLFLYKTACLLYNITMVRVLLCSASPRRRELLLKLISDFDVMSSGAEESSLYLRPHLRVMDLASSKGHSAERSEDRIVIASDTLVYRAGKYYGKPRDRMEAAAMLGELSGVWHSVYTGVWIGRGEREILFYDRAEVLFKTLSQDEIDRYIDLYAPLDKAGAYGIQDGVVVERYKGSFDTIMGLPTEKLGIYLERMGVKDVFK